VSESDRDVERRIAIAVARYLDGATYDQEAARLDVSKDLADPLGQLILRHVAEMELWSPWWSIDYAAPDLMEPVGPMTVEVIGFVWLEVDGANDDQPFRATLSLDQSRLALASYAIRFGDAAVGLSPTPDDRRRRLWPDVDDWLFTFTGPGDIPGH